MDNTSSISPVPAPAHQVTGLKRLGYTLGIAIEEGCAFTDGWALSNRPTIVAAVKAKRERVALLDEAAILAELA